MARGNKRGKAVGALQRLYNAQTVANDQSHLSVITPEQRAKGTYSEGRRIVNNHDPVERWKASGKLTQSQEVVIEMCQRLWRLAGLSQSVTARYDERTPASFGYELRALSEIEAREDLHRIQDHVPAPYWSVFEKCCRWGMPAGVVGSDLGFGDRSAQDRAHQIVVFVADVIAMKERV